MTLFALLLVCILLQSCTTCKECDCHKEGRVTIEEECAVTTDPEGYFRNWENSLIEHKGYDSCDCHYK